MTVTMSDAGASDDGDMFSNSDHLFPKRKHSDDELDSCEDANTVKLALSGKKKRKLKKLEEVKKLHKPPTVEEINRLRETENLFHSNLFRRQIEEMLAELKTSDKFKVRVSVWFEKMKEWLAKMEDSDEKYDLTNLTFLKERNIRVPLPQVKPVKGSYQFVKPTKINIVGSYNCETMLGHGPIDIVIEIPHKFFNKEDYLNGRYHLKRAIYLHELAQHLSLMSDLVEDVLFAADDGNASLPLLEITPPMKLKIKTKFVVNLVPEASSFKLNRFLVSKNNVRPKWFFTKPYEINDDSATPFYNNSVAEQITLVDNELRIKEFAAQNEQIRDGIILLKVWLRQRELHLGSSGFSGFLVSMLVFYLVHIRKINFTMSSYQIIRTVWNYLSTADWTSSGITLCNEASSEHQPSLHDFHRYFPLVFVDPSGFVNLTSRMSPLVFQQCKDEAVLALRYLDSPDLNSFQVLFMVPVPFYRQCDQFILFQNITTLNEIGLKYISEEKDLDYLGNSRRMVLEKLLDLLQRGLGQRVRALRIKLNPLSTWSVGKKARQKIGLTFGLILDPDHCFSVVEKDSTVNEEGTEAFRELWGDKSELRRFKDGSITEAVVWQAQSWKEKRLITRQIVQYLLSHHLGVGQDQYRFTADEVEDLLPSDRESQTADVLTSYEKLNKQLRDLEGLPLEVVSVQGTSSVFRCSDLFPPKIPDVLKKSESKNKKQNKMKTNGVCMVVNESGRSVPEWCSPAQAVIQLSPSNKWPHDLQAVRRVRAAFNLKIAQLLSETSGLTTHPYQDGFDVLMESCLFRIQVCYPGEVALLKKSVTPDGVVQYKDTVESFKYEKTLEYLPKLTSALHGVHSQHTSLGTACCIAKRWVRAHMIDEGHLSDEAVDLLVASVYLNPAPCLPPNQPQTAFLRFLYRLAHTNWSIEFILLNFNDELSREEVRKIESNFDNSRSTLPALFISTPYDKNRSIWTQSCSPVVLLRLINLAKLSYSFFESQLQSPNKLDLQTIFTPSHNVFDVRIDLVTPSVPRRDQNVQSEKPGGLKPVLSRKPLSVIPVVNFDPVDSYVTELRESYGEWALFFYDPYGGATVGVLWKPGHDEPRDVKVSHLHGRYLKDNKLHLNKLGILEGFHVLGHGLVKSVLVKQGTEFVPYAQSLH